MAITTAPTWEIMTATSVTIVTALWIVSILFSKDETVHSKLILSCIAAAIVIITWSVAALI